MKLIRNTAKVLSLAAILGSLAFTPWVQAQQATAAATSAPTPAPQAWTYKTKQLDRAEIDRLLSNPKGVVVIDVRRPDELIKNGSFPVYLSIQLADLEKSLDLIPKDRTIITVSNRAHRAGAAGDQLTAKGFKVAGAAGSLDYEDQGGAIARITPPPPRTPAAGAAAVVTPAAPK